MSSPILSSPSLSHHLLQTKNFLLVSSRKKFLPLYLPALSASISFMHLPSLSVLLLLPPSPVSLSFRRGRNSSAQQGNLFHCLFFSFFLSFLRYLSLISLHFLSTSLSTFSLLLSLLHHLTRNLFLISQVRNLLAVLFSLLRHASLSSSLFDLFSLLLLLSLSASPI